MSKHSSALERLQRKVETLEQQRDDLLEYAKAQERKDGGLRNPWGHDCDWCGECCGKLGTLRRAAIAKAEETP